MKGTCHKCGAKGVVGGPLSNGWAFVLVLIRDTQGAVIEKLYEPLCPACIQDKEVGLFVTTKRTNAFISRHKYEGED